LPMRLLVAAGQADAEPTGTGPETTAAASALTGTPALTAASTATRTLTLDNTSSHSATSFYAFLVHDP
jgi:hypothetical protein